MQDLEFSQFQKISQDQVLAPQVLRALKILQTPSLELGREIADELAKNPLLEEISGGDERSLAQLPSPHSPETDDVAHGDGEDVGSDAIPAFPPDGENENTGVQGGDGDFLEKEPWAEPELVPLPATEWTQSDEEKRNYLFDSLVERESLPQLLESQISLADAPAVPADLLRAIAQNIDDRGFLDVSVEALAITADVRAEKVEAALRVFQNFDPPGIGARDLREAFLIQLRRQRREDSLAYRILQNDYPLFLARKFSAIATRYGVSHAEVRAAIVEISKLKRVPSGDFSPDENREITPDLTFFFNVEKNAWDVRLENAYIPRLRISNVYKELIARGKIPAADKAYFSEKIRAGRFLINAIEQRQRTIEAIGRCIVAVQCEFLARGTAFLRPMKMASVAAEVGVHETTVSRAVSNKYVDTPHGIFEMRRFFSTGLGTADGEEIANTGVREVLRKILENESPQKPLSDEKLVAELASRGIKIARRTVAKYRAIMKVPPAHLRKKF